VAKARGAPERADALAAAAAAEGSCEARGQAYESAMARDAVADADAQARELLACPGGRDRLIQHLERRGALAAALEAAAPAARARPSALDAAFTRAELLLASGDAGAARRELEAVAAFWPESARLWKRLGDVRELAGDRAGARAARERALAADGSELALRRALALEDGREVLDELREDGGAAIEAYEQAGTAGDTSTALVLDASAQAFHPGGAVTDRTHQVIHVLDQRGVDKYGEVRLPPGAELLTLRTLKRDGKVLEPDGGRAKGAISLAGLEPGDYVEVEYLRASRGAIDGYAADPFYFQDEGERLVRSTYAVTAPAALGLEVDAQRMEPPPLVRDGDRVTVRALRTEVPGLVGEPGAPPLAEVLPFVQVGYGAGREVLHRRMANLAAGRARQTVELAAFAREVRQAAGRRASPEALARAAWRRVAERVLGSGGSLGDDASEILSRGRGSRTLLLKAVLDALGVEARIALVRPFEADPAPQRFPRHGLYRQTLLRIRAGGRELWIDPDERGAPFGSLPPPALDAEALVLSAPGEALEVVRTPAKAEVPSARATSVSVRVDGSGGATVEVTDRYSGHSAGVIRGALERFDATARRRIFEQTVSASFRGGALDGLEVKGEEDREGDLTLVYRANVPDFARRANGALVVESPILPARLGEGFVRLAERKLPLLISPQDPLEQRIELVAPDGFAVGAAPEVTLSSRWGRYHRAERVEGRTLVREEHVALSPARVAPSDYTDFARFVTEIDALQATPLRIGRGTNPGGRP
jgi:tetratricopeptide (TPR) repeat protein